MHATFTSPPPAAWETGQYFLIPTCDHADGSTRTHLVHPAAESDFGSCRRSPPTCPFEAFSYQCTNTRFAEESLGSVRHTPTLTRFSFVEI